MPDGTGDGSGFLTDIPKAFIAREALLIAPESAQCLFDGTAWGLATLFSSSDLPFATVEKLAIDVLSPMGIRLIAVRPVPLNLSPLGAMARAHAPRVTQLVIAWTPLASPVATMQLLFKAQRRLEEAFSAQNLPVYVVSFSDKTVIYKGMADGRTFSELYPDLHEPDFLVSTVVFHRRFATNTAPNWNMCQPFRLLCHNGEINTISGNRNGVRMWERYVRNCGIFPADWPSNALIPGQSDSADLDGALQAYRVEGRSLAYTAAILMPAAWENKAQDLSPEAKAFFEYHKRAMAGLGAWEGPAAIIAYDGHQLVISLDRMGLRPLRVAQTHDGIFLASSENGAFGQPAENIAFRNQLTSGSIVRFDLDSGRVVHSADVYFQILGETETRLHTTFREANAKQLRSPTRYGISEDNPHPDLLAWRNRMPALLRAFGWDSKHRQSSTDHLVDFGKEETYSLGLDRPIAALSLDAPTLYRYFHQRFALVTNPPIDPYREGRDMCLSTYLGRMPDVPPRVVEGAINLRIKSPILTTNAVEELLHSHDIPALRIPLQYPQNGTGNELKLAVDSVLEQCIDAVKDGTRILVLSDLGVFSENHWPIPAPIVVGALSDRLVESGLRPLCSIVVQSGEISEGHDAAVLLGLGANAVNPHVLFYYGMRRAQSQGKPGASGVRNVQEGMDESIRKIMSKMGICTIQGYVDSCLFEAVGLADDVIAYLPRVPSRIGGMSFPTLAEDICHRIKESQTLLDLPLFDSDERSYSDATRQALWQAAKSGSERDYQDYCFQAESRRPCTLRDLLDFKFPQELPIALEKLSPESVLQDCVTTGAMSHGALTARAHENIAAAANAIGLLSNSGEGGEDRRRNRGSVRENLRSRIRQVASGRFGVDAEYLVNADEIQIKMAQGAKPGEGGQLMATKVTDEIAKLRYCRPGIDLISPPPHHDIYSIEDLKQLINDLRAVNDSAKISVKLCAVTGIGAIAAGVVKAGADIIEIDGLEGGTGASPRPSIEHAGLPTELGLHETHVALSELGLRHLTILRAGGGIKTESDALKYILLGADQVTLATTLMIAQGCVHCNCCHTGNCPTLIAGSLNPKGSFPGSAEHVKRFLLSFGRAMVNLTAKLGFSHPKMLVGRTDLLQYRNLDYLKKYTDYRYRFRPDALLSRCHSINLSNLLTSPQPHSSTINCHPKGNQDRSMEQQMLSDNDLQNRITVGRGTSRSFDITSASSIDFAVAIAGKIAKQMGPRRLACKRSDPPRIQRYRWTKLRSVLRPWSRTASLRLMQ
jgi:glutamate synthase domain-containing protein 2/glutamate synthase domain-containing protein 1